MKKVISLLLILFISNGLSASVKLQFRNIAFKEGLNYMNVSGFIIFSLATILLNGNLLIAEVVTR